MISTKLKSLPIYLSLYNNIIKNQLQICYLPLELLKIMNLKIYDIIIINIDDDKQIICKIFPTIHTYCLHGYQIIASCDVKVNPVQIRNILEFENKLSKIQILYKDIVKKSLVETNQIYIIVIFSTVEMVIHYKNYRNHFESIISDLMNMYIIEKNSLIDCSNNEFAKLVGVSYIIVENIEYINEFDQLNQVGKITKNTKVNIVKIESLDHHNFQIEKPIKIGGMNHILEYLEKLISIACDMKEEFTHIPVPLYNLPGILLIGPPGCGKTSIVKELCARTRACLISTNGSELISPYQGETHSNLYKIAKKACSLSKENTCIFFIDEIDSICSSRDTTSTSQELQLTSQVILIFDECKKYPNLLLMAATNRPYALDQAVRRSGRLEVELLLNIPTESQRKDIIKVHSEDLLPADDSFLDVIANSTPGFVGADLKDLCVKVREKLSNAKTDENNVYELMAKTAEQITPSIHKSLNFITSKPKEMPLAGLEDVKEELDSIFMQFSKPRRICKKFKIKQPKGILLYGPRGCGKTRLVSQLGSRRGLNFISANASHLLSPYVGDSEKRIAALFHSARLAQPSVLFIDEIDGIFGSRENIGGVRINILNELLQAMDGADMGALSLQGANQIGSSIQDIQDGVIVCAATNHPQKLDSALLRPGRFDHMIYVPLPDEAARKDILKLKTEKLLLEEDSLTLDQVARETEGWTGAELEVMISQVALQSFSFNYDDKEKNKIYISKSLILNAIKNVTPSVTEKELKMYRDFQQRMSGIL